MALDKRLVSPKEPPLFILGVLVSSLCWAALTLLTLGFGLLYAVLTLGFVAMAHAVFLASVRGNGVRVGPGQLPDLHRRLVAASHRLGVERVPELYLLQSGGLLNAFATKLLSRRFVILYSSLGDACSDPRQLDFVLGHELGHLAAGHLAWNGFLLPFRLVPWLGAAYSRAREYTGDRCGLAVVEELEPAMRGLVVLAAGGKYAGEVNLHAFAEQRAESGRFWMATTELMSSHPFLCKRVAELQNLVHPGTVTPVPRTPLAYPLAPVLGMTAPGSSGVVFLVLLYLGVVFAFAAKELRTRLAQAGAAAPPGLQLPFVPDRNEDSEADPDDEDAAAEDPDEEEMQPVPGTLPGGKTYRE
ncbi:MAG TPA: M48 family metallopeptidase [Myxococcaceae bacterium]|nr:M48 family metallopeptidase [Myxococcaceae bacterium]